MLAETGRRVTLLGCSLSNGLIVQMIANRVALLLKVIDRWLSDQGYLRMRPLSPIYPRCFLGDIGDTISPLSPGDGGDMTSPLSPSLLVGLLCQPYMWVPDDSCLSVGSSLI